MTVYIYIYLCDYNLGEYSVPSSPQTVPATTKKIIKVLTFVPIVIRPFITLILMYQYIYIYLHAPRRKFKTSGFVLTNASCDEQLTNIS